MIWISMFMTGISLGYAAGDFRQGIATNGMLWLICAALWGRNVRFLYLKAQKEAQGGDSDDGC